MNKALLASFTRLTLSTTGVTTADITANITSSLFYFTVPDGEVLALPKLIRPRMKLIKTGTTAVERDTVWGFGFASTIDPYRVIPIGSQMFPATDFIDVAIGEQGKDEYERMTTFDITRKAPLIVINQDETLHFLVRSTGAVDVSECTVEIPVYRARTGDIATELAWRMLEIAR